MTIKRKPTDDGTPVMTLGNLAATAWLTVWDHVSKTGHVMQLSTLRAWLIAPAGVAGRVVVTDGTGGLADGGQTISEIIAAGGGEGGGGVPTVTMLTDADGEPGEGDLAPALVHTLTPSSGEVWFVDDGTQGAFRYGLLPTEPPLGTVIKARVAPVPPGEPGQDTATYVGTYPNPGLFAFDGDVGSGEPMPLESGVPVTFVCIREYDAEDATTPLWQVETNEGGLQGEQGDPGDPGPQGEQGLQGPPGLISALVGLYAPTGYLVGVEGEMPGAPAMTAAAVVRLLGIPAGEEVICGNFEFGTTTGGWGIGVNASGFKIWVARDSDGVIQESTPTGLAAFASYGGAAALLHRLVLVTLTVAGTSASLWINGALAQTVTLTGGLRPAEASGTFMVQRNRSAGTPMTAQTACWCGLHYNEIAQVGIYRRLLFTAIQRAGGVVQVEGYPGTGSVYRPEPPYSDTGPAGRSALTAVGYIGTESLIPQW